MADRAGTGKPANPNGAARGPPFPPPKSQAYGTSRPVYRPQPPKRRRGRSCCCSCCLWLTFLVVAIVFLLAIAAAVFYFIYRPHRPSFSVTSLALTSFNLTPSDLLYSRLAVDLTARNPNKKLEYVYDPIAVSASTSGVSLGDGSSPAFSQGAGNVTDLKIAVVCNGLKVDPGAAPDLKGKSSLPLDLLLETKAGVKVGGIKSKKVRVRVSCSGISVGVPKSKTSPAIARDASCEVKLRMKIWKWYLF